MNSSLPWFASILLVNPDKIEQSLRCVQASGLVPQTPNPWQITLGILRMWHRVFFRPETIGTSTTHPVRPSWRAHLFAYRPFRFPFLLAERAITPHDFSGLLSPPERMLCHLLGAHHDGDQFTYDLELLSIYPGWLERVRDAAREVVENDSERSRWLRDLCVYDRYHENLLAAVDKALRGELRLPPDRASNPDISFLGYLRWCARQPATPAETRALWLRGLYSIADGVPA